MFVLVPGVSSSHPLPNDITQAIKRRLVCLSAESRQEFTTIFNKPETVTVVTYKNIV